MESVFSLGPFTITPFGLIVFAGALFGVLLSFRKKDIGPVLPFVLLGALLFGHMWWVFFCPPGYSAEIGSARRMLRIWEGGYTLYGALFGGFIGAVIGSRLSGLHLTDVLDSLTPGAAAVPFFCRLGEYFTGQGFGDMVDDEGLWFLPVSFCTYQDEGYQEWNLAVWAWEAIVALILLAALLLIARKAVRGRQTVLFVSVLGTTQILLEQFRRDDFVRLNPFVRFTQIAALLSLIAVLILLVYRYRPGKKRILFSFAELVFASLTIVFAEFVFEKPQFRELLYIFSALAAVGYAVLLWSYRGRFRLPLSILAAGCTAALLAVHIADQWSNDTWLLYGLMVIALVEIGTIVVLNAGPRTDLQEG